MLVLGLRTSKGRQETSRLVALQQNFIIAIQYNTKLLINTIRVSEAVMSQINIFICNFQMKNANPTEIFFQPSFNIST